MYLPLTTDYEAAHLFLDQIDTNMIPTQGTSLSTALQTGLSAFSEDNSKFKTLILITDGEDHEGEAVSLAKQASKKGMVIHTVGVGTRSGSLIPSFGKNGDIDYNNIDDHDIFLNVDTNYYNVNTMNSLLDKIQNQCNKN